MVPGGVGLGLSIVRALVEGMGGSVSYRRRGGWTEFIVNLPLAQSPRRPDLTSGEASAVVSLPQVHGPVLASRRLGRK